MQISRPDEDWQAALARARAEGDARVAEAKRRAMQALFRQRDDEDILRMTTADWLRLQGRRKANEMGDR